MNTISFLPRVAFMALALGTAGVTATFAQTTTSTTTPAPTTAPTCTADGGHRHHHGGGILTPAERAQLKKAHEQALAANGTLQTDKASLKQQLETLKSASPAATKEQWQALHQQKEAFHQKLKAAELLIDPTLAPIFTKLEAAHNGHHHSAT